MWPAACGTPDRQTNPRGPESERVEDTTMLGYTRTNVRALVTAVIPRTPELAETHGEEHVPGGRDVDLTEYVVESFNGYQEHHLGALSTLLRRLGVRNYPYAVVVSLLLDVVALELLVRRDNEHPVEWRSLAGPFARLAPRDRLRALTLLETGALDTLAGLADDRLPVLGTVRFLALGVNAFPLLGYYSEWAGRDPASNPGWRQAGYPGPAEGYSEHMGYEVETFTDEWDPEELADGNPARRFSPERFEEWPPEDFGAVTDEDRAAETADSDPSGDGTAGGYSGGTREAGGR
jgi:hypothetical protein